MIAKAHFSQGLSHEVPELCSCSCRPLSLVGCCIVVVAHASHEQHVWWDAIVPPHEYMRLLHHRARWCSASSVGDGESACNSHRVDGQAVLASIGLPVSSDAHRVDLPCRSHDRFDGCLRCARPLHLLVLSLDWKQSCESRGRGLSVSQCTWRL